MGEAARACRNVIRERKNGRVARGKVSWRVMEEEDAGGKWFGKARTRRTKGGKKPARLAARSSRLLVDGGTLAELDGRFASGGLSRRSANSRKRKSVSYPTADTSACWSTHRSLICLAMVKKACSTFVAFFAEVSSIETPIWSANSFATLYSTTFFDVKSDLLPTRSLLTPSQA